jgi:hypothetical protein
VKGPQVYPSRKVTDSILLEYDVGHVEIIQDRSRPPFQPYLAKVTWTRVTVDGEVEVDHRGGVWELDLSVFAHQVLKGSRLSTVNKELYWLKWRWEDGVAPDWMNEIMAHSIERRDKWAAELGEPS